MKPINYGRQEITPDDLAAVQEVLQSDYLTQGPKIAEFEKAFATYIGADYAVAVSNGTAALHLSAMAMKVKPGDKIISTPITFAASTNAVLYCGGSVDFCDIDPDTFLIDLDTLEQKLSESPKGTYTGIIPVDFAGYPADAERLRKIADEYDLWIIEDACHAPGAYFTDSNGHRQNSGNGQFAELSIFSFHPVKHIATGEGGMISTNNKDLYDKLRLLRTHGITKDPDLLHENHGAWYYEMQELGYNYRLSDMQAALGISQLTRAKSNLDKRLAIARRYDEAFKETSVKTPYRADDIRHAFHLYVIQHPDRKALYNHLRAHQIYAQVHYIPVHLQAYYKNLGFKKGDYPNAENYYEKCLSIPMYPSLTVEEQEYVINTILEFIS